MAVTIEQMEVEVHEALAPAAPSAPADKPAQKISLEAALNIIYERKRRLKAD
jgi:hypothetical protein